MDWEKYNLVSNEFKTAREIGLAAATLGAMARRGFVEVQDGSPKKYRKINNPAIHIYRLLEENKDDYETYFTLRKEGAPYGMLCSLSDGTVLDCWGKPYDLTNVITIEFRTKKFNLKEI
jgi:hypothetical protein